MDFCLGVARKLSFWSERSDKKTSAEPSTRDGLEAVRTLCLVPLGSPFDRHSVIVFPLTVSNAGKKVSLAFCATRKPTTVAAPAAGPVGDSSD